MVTPKIGMLHYNWHFKMLTPIILVLIFISFFGGIAKQSHGPSSCLAVASRQQQDELNDDGPSTRSPYDNEGRQRHDRQVPRPALCHP